MAALVSEIKSRQAAKANKSRQSSSAANPIIGSADPDDIGSSGGGSRGGPIGGIMLGERGKEMIRERQRENDEGTTGGQEKSSGSWFGGRI